MSRLRVGSAIAAWLILIAILLAGRSKPAILTLGAIIALLAVGAALASDLDRARISDSWPQTQGAQLRQTRGSERVEHVRARARAAAKSESNSLHTTLVGLMDDRLLGKHGIDRIHDPESAEPLLTPLLRRLLEGPTRQLSQANLLAEILTEIETL